MAVLQRRRCYACDDALLRSTRDNIRPSVGNESVPKILIYDFDDNDFIGIAANRLD